jgi:DNA-binding transcriptional MerR regulator
MTEDSNTQPMELRLKAVAAESDTCAPVVRSYAELGLIEARRDSNGNWLFSADAPEQVRRVKAERMARCGGRKGS